MHAPHIYINMELRTPLFNFVMQTIHTGMPELHLRAAIQPN